MRYVALILALYFAMMPPATYGQGLLTLGVGVPVAAAGGGGGTISVIQHIFSYWNTDPDCTFSGNTMKCHFPSNTAAGNTVAGCITWGLGVSGTGITYTISDTQGLGYSIDSATRETVAATANFSEMGGECFHSTTTTSAAADTVSVLLSSGYEMGFSLYELHSTSGSVTYQTGSGGTGTGTSATAGSITPSANGSFIIVSSYANVSGGSYVAGTNFTLNGTYTGGTATLGDEYWAQTTAAATTGPITLGVSAQWTESMTVFHP